MELGSKDHLLFYADCVGVFCCVFFRLQMVNPDIDKRELKAIYSVINFGASSQREIKLRLILHLLHGYYINEDPF